MQIYKSIIHHNLLLSDVSCWFSLWKIVKTHMKTPTTYPAASTYKVPIHPKPGPPTWAHAQCNGEDLGDATLGPTLGINALPFRFRIQEMIVLKVLTKHKQRVGILRDSIPTWYIICIISHVVLKVCMFKTTTNIQTWTRTRKFPADTSTKSKFSTKTRLWVASVTACLAAQGD